MSKIFEALHREPEQVPSAMLSSLFDETPSLKERRSDASQQVEARLPREAGVIVEDPRPAVSPGVVPSVDLQWDRVRTLPISLNSAVPLLPFDDPDSAAAEQYRIIRTRLIQHPKQPRMLLISSAGPADGKSVTAVNLAGALSLKSDAKVLLADTDFRRSTIHAQLGVPVSPGLTDVLSGAATLEEALVRTEQLPNLYVIPAGEPCPNPSELLDSPHWTTICNRLRNLFRYVIADSPPVASVADYELLQAACDGVILVARPDHTSRMGFSKVLELVPEGKLIGVVMNCVPDWFLGRNYYYAPYYYGNGRKS